VSTALLLLSSVTVWRLGSGYPLSQFVTYCADHYLSSEHKEVRLEAVKTCSHLLTPSLTVSDLHCRLST